MYVCLFKVKGWNYVIATQALFGYHCYLFLIYFCVALEWLLFDWIVLKKWFESKSQCYCLSNNEWCSYLQSIVCFSIQRWRQIPARYPGRQTLWKGYNDLEHPEQPQNRISTQSFGRSCSSVIRGLKVWRPWWISRQVHTQTSHPWSIATVSSIMPSWAI